MKQSILLGINLILSARASLRPDLHTLKFNDFSRLRTEPSPSLIRRDLYARQDSTPRFLDDETAKFAVNGTTVPDVDFDVGESYAGLLPISKDPDEDQHMFFWFFPTVNEEHADDKEIVIWLNGGPGCSSLFGLFQENGPFIQPPGLRGPEQNPWSWHRLTNIVYVEQPVGVGFSQGPVTITNEDELSEQFLGFWKNFIDTFSMQGYKIYMTAESYGGVYGPYISSHMLDADDTKYYDLQGLLIYNGLIGDKTQNVQRQAGLKSFIEQHYGLLPFDENFMKYFVNMSDYCGFDEYERQHLTYPPSEPAPTIPPGTKLRPNGTLEIDQDCEILFVDVFNAAWDLNPCFDPYKVSKGCPLPYDALSTAAPYFNRADVKKAIHAPLNITWEQCTDGFATPNGFDTSPPPDLHELPHVIDKTQNVIIAHGALDIALPLNGLLLAIQNMTWSDGVRGFQEAPQSPFYVPRYDYEVYALELPAGFGVQGTTHTERGLTLVVTALSGHTGPTDAAGGSFRHLEKLLGRVDSLSEVSGFTLPELRNTTQDAGPFTKGTVKIPCVGKTC